MKIIKTSKEKEKIISKLVKEVSEYRAKILDDFAKAYLAISKQKTTKNRF